METSATYTNRLIHEKSPYLLQHAHNPVDWYPWGSEVFERAKEENKMVLVSIGYATCHWCHVMERESFEDPKLAEFLNQHFLAVKVDREERPDVDKIYMDALHALGQQGGWPLNMFVTPEGLPVTGGTYFPPTERYGRSSFRTVLASVAQVWENDRNKVIDTSVSISDHLRSQGTLVANGKPDFDWSAEDHAVKQFKDTFDEDDGGFSLQQQNKFPPSMGLMLLLRHHLRTGDVAALKMTEFTLQKMFQGGIYDQLGGGLSRYSTDYQWLVPHFEKMLYDNALFTWALIETHQSTGQQFYKDAAADVLQYIERDMRSPEGAFYSAEDADSEGVEGKFYVWNPEEITEILGENIGKQAGLFWDVSPNGNFEHGQSILHRPNPLAEIADSLQISAEQLHANMESARQKLLEARSKRIRPLCDDKILTSWNGLIISAFARAARVFENPHYGKLAEEAAEFIFSKLMDNEGRLLRRYRDGEANYRAYLCDHSQMATACLDLYEHSYDLKWLTRAFDLMEQVNHLFRNENGPYFDTASDAELLLTRNMEGYDGVEPSGNSAAALAFLKLHAYGMGESYEDDALRILNGFEKHLEQAGVSFAAMHWALHFHLADAQQVVVIGERGDSATEALLEVVRSEFHPNIVTAFVSKNEVEHTSQIIPVVQGRIAVDGKATAYVCQHQTCQLPVQTAQDLKEQLK